MEDPGDVPRARRAHHPELLRGGRAVRQVPEGGDVDALRQRALLSPDGAQVSGAELSGRI